MLVDELILKGRYVKACLEKGTDRRLQRCVESAFVGLGWELLLFSYADKGF